MTFAENRTYGVPEFAGTEVNRHSGKLKGLSGYLQNHHDTMVEDKTQQFTSLSQICLQVLICNKDEPPMLICLPEDKMNLQCNK